MNGRTSKPRLYLDNAKKSETLIVLSYKYVPKEKPLRYSTRQWIAPGDWDGKKGEPKDFQKHRALNDFLKSAVAHAVDIFGSMGPISHKEFKLELDYRLGFEERPELKKKPAGIAEFVQWHLGQMKLDGDMDYSDGYLRSLKNAAKMLLLFLDKHPHTFEEIGKSFWSAFRKDIMREGRTLNYINKKTKQVSSFFEAADMEGLMEYTNRKKPSDLKDEDVYFDLLTDTEIATIEAMKLTGLQQKCRDCFLIGCYTSLRVSEYMQLSKDNLIQDGEHLTLKVKPKKTGNWVWIPVDPKCRAILERYGWGAPANEKGRPLSDVTINRVIKEVVRAAGINYEIKETRTRAVGGKWKEETKLVKKADTISTHYGRRYWATYWYKRGIPIAKLMLVTGHKKESTFLRYINIDRHENAKELQMEMREKKNERLQRVFATEDV